MRSLDKISGVDYIPKLDWPIKDNLKFQKRITPNLSDEDLDDFFLGSKEVLDRNYANGTIAYTLYTFQPLNSNRLYYYLGKWHDLSFNIHCSAESLESVEEKGWEFYNNILKCEHNFNKYDWSLNGDGQCLKCHIVVNNFFMDDKLWEARNLAHLAYSSNPENPLMNKIRAIYQRVAHLAQIEKHLHINIACLAWLHTILDDFPKLEISIEEKCGTDVLELIQQYKEFNAGELRNFRKAPYAVKLIKLICAIQENEVIIDTQTDPELMFSAYQNGNYLLNILKGIDPYLENFYTSNLNFLKKKSLKI